MTYASYFRTMPMPVGYGGLATVLGAWMYINVFNGKPALWTREISKAEFNATPTPYLRHPDHHVVRAQAVPGQSAVPDALGELHKAHAAAKH